MNGFCLSMKYNGTANGADVSLKKKYMDSKECDISPGLAEEIVKFIEDLSSIGQEAGEWIGHYINKIELGILEGETLRKAGFCFLEKQLAHLEQYKNFRKI